MALLQLLRGDGRFGAVAAAWGCSPSGVCCLETLDAAPDPAEAWRAERPAVVDLLNLAIPGLDGLPRLGEWLADAIVLAVCAGDADSRVEFQLERPWASRERRASKTVGGKGTTERDATWFYRHKLRVPAVSVKQLAREYAASEQRNTNARSVVQDGIKRMAAFLAE